MPITIDLNVSKTLPFWHRVDPVAATVRIDPEFEKLRRMFPVSWKHLVAAKLCVDCLATIDQPQVELLPGTLASQLIKEMCRHLEAFVDAEQHAGDLKVAQDVEAQVRALREYAGTGHWPTYVVPTPRRESRWVYCGPLGTWAGNVVETPVSLLVTQHDPMLQSVIDEVSQSQDIVAERVASTLGSVAQTTEDPPLMFSSDLVLTGGTESFGHKNFAHFFPLESPCGQVDGPDFTIVYSNVHRARLVRCSLPLLQQATGEVVRRNPSDIAAASLRWFRCHDLGHLWRRPNSAPRTKPSEDLDEFGLMAIEETYADLLGLICADAFGDCGSLVTAFAAELVRYLSRDQGSFADSVAAAIEAGWLTSRAGEWLPRDPSWLGRALEDFYELVPILYDTLWSGPGADIGPLLAAVAVGRKELVNQDALYRDVPTDIIYTFG